MAGGHHIVEDFIPRTLVLVCPLDKLKIFLDSPICVLPGAEDVVDIPLVILS